MNQAILGNEHFLHPDELSTLWAGTGTSEKEKQQSEQAEVSSNATCTTSEVSICTLEFEQSKTYA